jgi:diguanylate cyclase (GGDEF)-like protein
MSDQFGTGLKVLVVDDEQMVLQVFTKALKGAGFEVEAAVTFGEAANLIANKCYDLALLDKNLPDGDGLTLAQRIGDAGWDCEVAIITGYASLESAIEALRVKVADYLIKPVNISQIRDRTRRMVDHLLLKRQHNKLVKELDHTSKTVEKLRAQATRDPLTGLFNHAYFQDQLANEIARCKRYEHDLGLLFMDVDSFKQINDNLGHQVGDRVLTSIADILKGTSRNVDIRFRLREHDIAARYGGDEFVLLLPETPKGGASITAERLRKGVEQFNFRLDVPTRITLSIGVAEFPADATDRDGLIAAADLALYAAKQSGRNRVIAYSEDLANVDPKNPWDSILDVKRTAGLEKLLAEESIEFVFQPIVDAKTRDVFGYEAFCRPDQNLFPTPIEMILTAERSGKIGELGRLLREQAVCKISEMPADCCLFVNLHPQELNDPSLLDEKSLLNRHADRIVFEINKSKEIVDQSRLRKTLVRLRERGFRIALDDLCTGYLGLASLVRLEPDFLKMDVSLLHNVSTEGRASRLIKHYLDYTAGENIKVIASGIETEKQKQVAVYLGCPLLQGYLFSKAQPGFTSFSK